ncbi:glycosyltransferase family 4 protein [Methylophaga sp.]|uniref:glycosyltransferase family 4 protein n=1 Tax=Methylophaga sp. TaxID=2024840 RepID=UPI003A8FE1E9
MRVLHLIAGSLSGGAARGAYWLHLAQRKLGVDSCLLTNEGKNIPDEGVYALEKVPSRRIKLSLMGCLERALIGAYRERSRIIFNLGLIGDDFTKHPAYRAADIIHLHWVNGMVAVRALKKIKKPVVWTLRDMWPLTGGCHYAMGCVRYKEGCGFCPQLGSNKGWDISRFAAFNKKRSLPNQMEVVGISDWISQTASDSFIFKGHRIHTISNNIDTQKFSPVLPELARSVLNLPSDKKVILVGAQILTDFYKGFHLFLESLDYLPRENLHVVSFGNDAGNAIDNLGVEHTRLGFLRDPISLRLAYSAANVFVAPSIEEAFGKTLAEAMSCGTPVVCFNAAGPKDIVVHQVNGFKAIPFDPKHLASGVQWVLNQSPDAYSKLRESARSHAVDNFDSRVIAMKYHDLYGQILSSRTKK